MTRKEREKLGNACFWAPTVAERDAARLMLHHHVARQWEQERQMPLHKLCAKILREAPRPPGCTRTLPAWLVDGLPRTTTA